MFKHTYAFTNLKSDMTISKIKIEFQLTGQFPSMWSKHLYCNSSLESGLGSEGCLPHGIIQNKLHNMFSFKEHTKEFPKQTVKTSKAHNSPVCGCSRQDPASLPCLSRLPSFRCKCSQSPGRLPTPVLQPRWPAPRGTGLLLPPPSSEGSVFYKSTEKAFSCRLCPTRKPVRKEGHIWGVTSPGTSESRSLGRWASRSLPAGQPWVTREGTQA